jgi:hypothetical protein
MKKKKMKVKNTRGEKKEKKRKGGEKEVERREE